MHQEEVFWEGESSQVTMVIPIDDEITQKIFKAIEEQNDLVDYMDAKAMETMLKMEGDVFAVINEKPSDPSTFIMLAVERLNNWT